jgi:hypothetical protein
VSKNKQTKQIFKNKLKVEREIKKKEKPESGKKVSSGEKYSK